MELFDFGKHAPYIWSSFALTFVVLIANVLAARISHQRVLHELRRVREGKPS